MSRLERLREAAARHPRRLEVALGFALFLVLGWFIQAEQGGVRAPDALAYLCVFWLGALLLLRRRYPLGVLMASVMVLGLYYVLGYPNIGFGIPLSPALYFAAAARRLKWPIAIATCLISLIVITSVFVPSYENQLTLMIFSFVPDVALMAAVITLGDSARSQRAIRARTQRLIEMIGEQERAEAQAAAATDRTRIAQELHDALGHQTTLVLLHADVAREALPPGNEVTESSIDVIRDTSRRMMVDLRNTVRTLREQDPEITTPSLDELRPMVFDQLPIDVAETLDVPHTLPGPVANAAYRIVQEALNNVVKHSRAERVAVEIHGQENHLEIVVQDSGPRRPETSLVTSGFGIIGMKERARALGGWASAESVGGGFRVRARLPVKVPAQVGVR